MNTPEHTDRNTVRHVNTEKEKTVHNGGHTGCEQMNSLKIKVALFPICIDPTDQRAFKGLFMFSAC